MIAAWMPRGSIPEPLPVYAVHRPGRHVQPCKTRTALYPLLYMQILVRLALVCFCALAAAMPSRAAGEAALARYIAAMVSGQDGRVVEALARIESPGRK